jgi:hypothetical protein
MTILYYTVTALLNNKYIAIETLIELVNYYNPRKLMC